jgi:hypothetical protein
MIEANAHKKKGFSWGFDNGTRLGNKDKNPSNFIAGLLII